MNRDSDPCDKAQREYCVWSCRGRLQLFEGNFEVLLRTESAGKELTCWRLTSARGEGGVEASGPEMARAPDAREP